jgi:hypothetical protein
MSNSAGNPTAIVPQWLRLVTDRKKKWLFPSAADFYYPGEMIGRRLSDGLAVHCDDTQALQFIGIFEGPQFRITSDLPTAGLVRDLYQPYQFAMPLAGAQATASRINDLHRAVYAYDSGHVTLTPGETTFLNLVGWVDDVAVSDPATMTGSVVWIRPYVPGLPSQTYEPTGVVAASGTTINNAVILPYGYSYVTGANNTAAVELPAPVAGQAVTIQNASAASVLLVFPSPASQINSKGNNTAVNIPAGGVRTFTSVNNAQWGGQLEAIA